jgi:hypothetical protein
MSGMAWILLGALVVALLFFALVFAQILSIESRLRKLVVSTESRIAVVFGLRLSPPGETNQTETVISGRKGDGDEE